MSYCRQDLEIHTSATEAQIKNMAQPIVDFANKHGVEFCIGFTDKNEWISHCVLEGRTSAYCKGIAAEVKQMIKDVFHCKVSVILYMY